MQWFFIIITALIFPAFAHAGPDLQLDGIRYEAGRVEQGRQISHDFKLTNAGDEDIIIEKLEPN